jgi:hypothetical protein
MFIPYLPIFTIYFMYKLTLSIVDNEFSLYSVSIHYIFPFLHEQPGLGQSGA